MQIKITGVHLEVTEAIKHYTEDKLMSLGKFIQGDSTGILLEVELSKTTNHHQHGDFFQVDVHVRRPGKDIVVSTTEEDLYKAIDVSKDKLTRELTAYKDKERSVFRRGAHKVKQLMKRLTD